VTDFISHRVVFRDSKAGTDGHQPLVAEEPLSIRVQGNPYTVIMRTPGEEIAHATGFCLAEGLIDSTEDYVSLGFCDGEDTNVITVTLTPERAGNIQPRLERRGYISQTSCGLCGKEIVADLYQTIKPLQDTRKVNIQKAIDCLNTLASHQPLRQNTRASHAAIIFDGALNLLSGAEDVGRHNALDKAIGKALLQGTLKHALLLVLSSRISYELVQKAARARIPIIVAKSRPTSLAVELATELNMTLASPFEKDGLVIYCNAQRLAGKQ
jgi:FdhD protein